MSVNSINYQIKNIFVSVFNKNSDKKYFLRGLEGLCYEEDITT